MMTSIVDTFQSAVVSENPVNNGRVAGFTIDGGVFTQVGGDYNNYNIQGNLHQHNAELGLYALGQFISHSAIHDSSERFPPPNCHPATRQRVRELIMEWIEDPNPPSPILWLHGPAGAGKSAILQSIAELCLDSGNYSASFFFTRGKPGRDQGRYLFPTIAYQLALNIPGLRGHVDDIMTSMPGCHIKTIGVQLRTLIIDSFSRLQEHPDLTATVIIDGLDECENTDVQQMIVSSIADALVASNIPLRFLIASRPEVHIRETFDSPVLRSITRRIVLDESFNPNHDIAIYLQDGFQSIYLKNIAIMSHIQKPWPDEDVIDLLVQKASGQFIYADTVLKFVGAELCRPSKQLEILLKNTLDQSRPTAFPDLDALYTQILSTSPHRETLISILGVILALHCPQPAQVIEGILDLEQGEVNLVLRPIFSLVRVSDFVDDNLQPDEEDDTSDEKDSIRFYHASFYDYLVDEKRSGAFYIDIELAKTQLTLAGFRLVATRVSLSQQYLNIPDPRTWGYLKWHLSPHFWECGEQDRDDIIRMLRNAQQRFWETIYTDLLDEAFYEAIHCALTALVHMMYTRREWPETWNHSDVGTDQTLLGLLEEYPSDPENIFDPILSDIFHEYRDGILDHCYDYSFSSGSMAKLLDFIPGFSVIMQAQTCNSIALILDVDVQTILDLVEENKAFIRFTQHSLNNSINISLKMHTRDYLHDATRTGPHFRNPKLGHIAICHRSLWYIFERHWTYLDDASTAVVRRYFDMNFEKHLEGIHIDPSDNEICTTAMLELLNHLGRLTFCQNPEQYEEAPCYILHIIWSAILSILEWVQRQRLECAGDSSHITQKLDSIRNQIYSQILCKETIGDEIVVGLRPHLLAGARESGLDPKSWFHSASSPDSSMEKACAHRVSDNFLLFDQIIPSLTAYITNPNLAGGLYIPLDVYHTQFAEYWLERCAPRSKAIPPLSDPIERGKNLWASRYWVNHLPYALPTEKLFDRLRNIHDFDFITDTLPLIDSLQLIVTWLETLPEPPPDIYLRWQKAILEREEAELPEPVSPSSGSITQTTPRLTSSISVSWASSPEADDERWIYFVWTIGFWIFNPIQMPWRTGKRRPL